MTDANLSPQLGGQTRQSGPGDATGDEPELSGARRLTWALGDTCKCGYCEYLRNKPSWTHTFDFPPPRLATEDDE